MHTDYSTTDLPICASVYKLSGKGRDSESGLDYFGARHYASTTGRFLSPDFNESGSNPEPVPYANYANPQSLNLYAYVTNNPLSLTDLDGHACDDSQGTLTSDTSLDEGGGTTVETVGVSGECNPSPVPLTQVQSNTQVDRIRPCNAILLQERLLM